MAFVNGGGKPLEWVLTAVREFAAQEAIVAASPDGPTQTARLVSGLRRFVGKARRPESLPPTRRGRHPMRTRPNACLPRNGPLRWPQRTILRVWHSSRPSPRWDHERPAERHAGALPRDDTAECSVLEAVLATPGALETVRAFLPADAFDNPDRRKIYAAALAVRDAGDEVDGSAILAWLRDRGEPWENLGWCSGDHRRRCVCPLGAERTTARRPVARAGACQSGPVDLGQGHIEHGRSGHLRGGCPEQPGAILDARQAEDDAGHCVNR